MILLDAEGNYLFVNELYRKIFSINPEDLSSISFTESLPIDDLESFVLAMEECRTNNCTINLDLRNKRKDGSVFWTRWEFFSFKDEADNKPLLQGIGFDITERKRAEEEKLFARKSLQIILDNTEESFIVTDTDLDIVSYNARANQLTYELSGVKLKQGLPILMYLRGLEETEFEALFQKALKGHGQENEVKAETLDGRTIIFSNTFRPLFNERNEVYGVIFTSREVTAKKIVEMALQESEEKYRILFLSNPQPMWVYDKETLRFLEVNNAALHHYGYTREEFSRMTIKDIRPKEDVVLLMEQLNTSSSIHGVIINNKIWRHYKKSGELIYVELKSHSIIYEGKKAAFVSVNDITKMVETEQALLKSNERFEMAGEATSDAIWDADFHQKTLHWGKGFEKLFGYRSNEHEDWESTWFDRIHEEDRHRVKVDFNKVVYDAKETFWSDEYRFIKSNGEVSYVVDKGIILRDENGDPVRMIGAMQDITERKKYEESLARERHLLRTLIDHIPDLIFVKDIHLRHVINNKATVERIGAKSELDTLGKNIVDYYGDSAEPYLEYDREVIRTGKAMEIKEDKIYRPNGDFQWLNTTLIPLKEHGRVIGLVGISRDITERKKIEESLRESNEIFRIVSQATNDTIFDVDFPGWKVKWSDAISVNFGYQEKETSLNWWKEKMEPNEFNLMEVKLRYSFKNKLSNWQEEMHFRAADGILRPVYVRGFILYNEKGEAYRMIGTLVDLTEIKQLQEQLQEEKVLKQREITEATIQAQEKERTEIGRELHDNINQILTTTKLYIDLAMHEPEFIDEMLKKSYSNISTAIDEIRVLSKSLVPPSLGDIGIGEAVKDMLANLRVAGSVKIDFITDKIDELYIPGDMELMVFRIIQEQVNNIIKHSRATMAEIKLSGNEKMLNITIRDNGVGFDPAKKNKGIGLNNITSRAELHNGTVDVISSPGQGCLLKVAIPIK